MARIFSRYGPQVNQRYGQAPKRARGVSASPNDPECIAARTVIQELLRGTDTATRDFVLAYAAKMWWNGDAPSVVVKFVEDCVSGRPVRLSDDAD